MGLFKNAWNLDVAISTDGIRKPDWSERKIEEACPQMKRVGEGILRQSDEEQHKSKAKFGFFLWWLFGNEKTPQKNYLKKSSENLV
jgi:hypothetical protein